MNLFFVLFVLFILARCWCSSVGSIGAAPAITTTSSDVDTTLDTIEDAVSPGLRLKYTNRYE